VKKFMVIDMGGGTVDMTLHKSEASLRGGDLSLAEVTHRECLPEVSWQCVF
jgi:molecular chaperone DnaK (HSP70)